MTQSPVLAVRQRLDARPAELDCPASGPMLIEVAGVIMVWS